MRPITVFLVLIALVFSGLTAFLANRVVSEKVAVKQATVKVEPTLNVLVAAKNISAGEVLDSSSWRWQKWPEEAVGDDFLTDKSGKDKVKEKFLSSVARSAILKNEVLLENKVFKKDKASFMAAALEPGMRAVGLPVSPKTGFTGFVKPGDFVDIILVMGVDRSSSASSMNDTVLSHSSETILRNIKVLAVGANTKDLDSGADDKSLSKKPAKDITVSVTPKQAEVLALAQEIGTVSIAQRSFSSKSLKAVSEQAFTSDLDVSNALNAVNRGQVYKGITVYRGKGVSGP